MISNNKLNLKTLTLKKCTCYYLKLQITLFKNKEVTITPKHQKIGAKLPKKSLKNIKPRPETLLNPKHQIYPKTKL